MTVTVGVFCCTVAARGGKSTVMSGRQALDTISALAQPVLASQESAVQALPSSHSTVMPLHRVTLQVSSLVQAVPSSQGEVLAAKTQPDFGSQLSSVQTFLSSQSKGLTPGWHAAPLQVSAKVQALLSSHGTLLALCTGPMAGLHESSVHRLLSSGLTTAPRQAPWLHVSKAVHAFRSSQPMVLNGKTQPCLASHASSVHGLVSVHRLAIEPCWQPFLASQLSIVHKSASSHEVAAPGRHAAALQMSPIVHALPSSQFAALAV